MSSTSLKFLQDSALSIASGQLPVWSLDHLILTLLSDPLIKNPGIPDR